LIVICDTSPLNYLILIKQEQVIPFLFQEVVTTLEVVDELRAVGAPPAVQTWASNPPPWLRVLSSFPIELSMQLGKGEASAIALASELRKERTDVTVLIDERDGREAAQARGLPTVGTLAVLAEAARSNLLDLPSAIADLEKTSFRIKPEIVEEVLRLHREWGQS
jgi:predicted nucleic acid-binding protein